MRKLSGGARVKWDVEWFTCAHVPSSRQPFRWELKCAWRCRISKELSIDESHEKICRIDWRCEVMKSHSHRHQMQFILIWFVFQFSLAEHDMNFFEKKNQTSRPIFLVLLFHLSSIPPLERQQQHFWIDFDGDARTSPEKFLSPLFFTHKIVDTFSLALLGLQWPSVSVVRWWWWTGMRPAHIDDYIGLQTPSNRTSQPQKSNHHRHDVAAAAQHWVRLQNSMLSSWM